MVNREDFTTDQERMKSVLLKWKGIYDALQRGQKVQNISCDSCAFCAEYSSSAVNCHGCPIKMHDSAGCGYGSPYYKFVVDKTPENALHQLEVLQEIAEDMGFETEPWNVKENKYQLLAKELNELFSGNVAKVGNVKVECDNIDVTVFFSNNTLYTNDLEKLFKMATKHKACLWMSDFHDSNIRAVFHSIGYRNEWFETPKAETKTSDVQTIKMTSFQGEKIELIVNKETNVVGHDHLEIAQDGKIIAFAHIVMNEIPKIDVYKGCA